RRARLAGLSRCPLAVAARGSRLELEPDRREAQQWTLIGAVDIQVQRRRAVALARPPVGPEDNGRVPVTGGQEARLPDLGQDGNGAGGSVLRQRPGGSRLERGGEQCRVDGELLGGRPQVLWQAHLGDPRVTSAPPERGEHPGVGAVLGRGSTTEPAAVVRPPPLRSLDEYAGWEGSRLRPLLGRGEGGLPLA